MTAEHVPVLRKLEGQTISISLADGSRIDCCQLVSVGRHRTTTLWVYSDGQDRFIPVEDVVDCWEAA